MHTWKKPLAIAFATAGVFVGSAIPNLLAAQTTVVSRNQLTHPNEFAQDQIPFSTPYEKWAGSTLPKTESTQHVELPQIQTTTSSPFVETQPKAEASSHQDFVRRPNDFQTTDSIVPLVPLPREVDSNLPTVIVRPPVNSSSNLKDLTVDIEKLAGSNGLGFAVRLNVPDSVKIIEITPTKNTGSQRNIKIRLDQPTNQSLAQQRNGSSASSFSMPIAAPVRSASSLNAVQPRNSNAEPTVVPGLEWTPTKSGFQKNPYFQQKTKPRPAEKPPIVLAPRTFGPPIVEEANEPALMASTLSHEDPEATTAATVSFSDEVAEAPASQMAFATSFESVDTAQLALSGPDQMGLGDIGDFTIYVNNPTPDTLENLTVQLDIPDGLEVVLLDRDAVFNRDAATLKWSISGLAANQEQFIRYRVKSLSEGSQTQQVTIGSQSASSVEIELDTTVSVEHETSDAPLLPYESN